MGARGKYCICKRGCEAVLEAHRRATKDEEESNTEEGIRGILLFGCFRDVTEAGMNLIRVLRFFEKFLKDDWSWL